MSGFSTGRPPFCFRVIVNQSESLPRLRGESPTSLCDIALLATLIKTIATFYLRMLFYFAPLLLYRCIRFAPFGIWF